MSLSLLAQVALAAGPIVAFLEGTVVYALSQQWEDLLSTYLLRRCCRNELDVEFRIV